MDELVKDNSEIIKKRRWNLNECGKEFRVEREKKSLKRVFKKYKKKVFLLFFLPKRRYKKWRTLAVAEGLSAFLFVQIEPS